MHLPWHDKWSLSLLKRSTPFIWTDDLNKVLHQSKGIITDGIKEGLCLLTLIDRPVMLITGLLMAMVSSLCKCVSKTPACCNDGWKLCLVGSKFTHPAESKYVPIKGDVLEVAYTLHHTRYYVLGCKDLIVATDHKPFYIYWIIGRPPTLFTRFPDQDK